MRILLVDDHPLFLDGMRNLLTLRGMEIVGAARDGQEALEKARALHPDVILMDIDMPRLDGLAATRLIKAELPDVRIVILSMSASDADLFEALKCGACGYLLKAENTERFFDLLTGLIRGEAPLSPGLASRVLKELSLLQNKGGEQRSSAAEQKEEERLTPRQVEVLTLVSLGLIYKEIGDRLCLSERTIKYHMGEIVQKLHLKNRREAIAYARQMGWDKPQRERGVR